MNLGFVGLDCEHFSEKTDYANQRLVRPGACHRDTPHPLRFPQGSTHPARGSVRYAVGNVKESDASSPEALRHGQQDSELRHSHGIPDPVTSG